MFEGINLTTLTPSALLGIGILLVFLGRLVPYRSHRETVEEAERWRKAYEAEREARNVANSQTIELLEVARTSKSILVALYDATERIRGPGGQGDVVSSTQEGR